MEWTEISSAFDQLVHKDPQSRAIELENLKRDHQEFAQELESLLNAHDRAEDFLEKKIPRLFGSLFSDLSLARGDKVLHFEIVEAIGMGSLASVYLAKDTELGRLVALKISLNQSQEASTLAHFSLDGIVQVFSEHVVDREGLALRVICLEYVAGPTLGRLYEELARNPSETVIGALEKLTQGTVAQGSVAFEPAALHWRETLGGLTRTEGIVFLVAKVAEILQHAHARGVLHLDLKPENILIDAYGRPYLSDFNVSTFEARIAGGDIKGLGGTPRFMSPEQKLFFEDGTTEAAKKLCGQSDVYSLGVLLKLFLDSSTETDQPLRAIIARATTSESGLRTLSAAAFAEDLRDWLRRSHAEKEMPPIAKGFRWIQNHPMWAIIGLTMASQILASLINISYNQMQIISELTAAQNQIFTTCVVLYNLVTYPFSVYFGFLALRPLFLSQPDLTKARRSTLLTPLVVFLAISLGWLPGAYLFPVTIDLFAGPLSRDVYLQFAGSISIAWLMSLTTSLAVTLYVLARSLYPRYWSGRSEVAAIELKQCERLNHALTFLAASVPLAGAFLVIWLAPSEYSVSDYRSFKILLMATVGFGLLNLLLVQRLTQVTDRSFRALKRPRPFG